MISRSRRSFRVRTGDGTLTCYFRGRVAEDERPVVGDRVRVHAEGGEGVLDEILPRRNALMRVAEDDPSRVKRVAANIDRLHVVLAASPFPPRWALADRLLALCEQEDFEAVIVVNKIDLVESDSDEWRELEEAASVYRELGFPVLLTSAVDGRGLDELRESLRDRIGVLSGHSGVGKSSLLNALHPDWDLATGEVNPLTSKGRQTTTGSRLLRLPSGGHVVDTPGFREFGLGHLEPADLGRCYREFRPFISECRFADCLHHGDPDCGVERAVEAGAISELRYGNYLRILEGLRQGGG